MRVWICLFMITASHAHISDVFTDSSRLVITVGNASRAELLAGMLTNETREALLTNMREQLNHSCTLIKHYGRRMVWDLGRGVDVDVDSQFILSAYTLTFPSFFPADGWSTELDTMVGYNAQPILLAQAMNDNSTLAENNTVPWHLRDDEPYSLQMEYMWSLIQNTTINRTVVAILDGGLPDFLFNNTYFEGMQPGYDFISDTDISLDGDGRDPLPIDPGDGGPPCNWESSWHGTKMASALSLNHYTLGPISMIPFLTSIQPIRVLGECSMGYANDVTDAIVWAVGGQINGIPINPDPARIVSMSFSGNGPCPSYLQSAVTMAVAYGAILVAAAGNQGSNVSNAFPANCKGVLAIGSSTRDGQLAGYSNRGAQITMLAPGGPITTVTVVGSDLAVEWGSGTSYSTVFAAGMVVLFDWLLPQADFSYIYPAYSMTPFPPSATVCISDCGKGIVSGMAMYRHLNTSVAIPYETRPITQNMTIYIPPGPYPSVKAAVAGCSPGTYMTSTSTTICTNCSAGTYSLTTNSSSCTNVFTWNASNYPGITPSPTLTTSQGARAASSSWFLPGNGIGEAYSSGWICYGVACTPTTVNGIWFLASGANNPATGQIFLQSVWAAGSFCYMTWISGVSNAFYLPKITSAMGYLTFEFIHGPVNWGAWMNFGVDLNSNGVIDAGSATEIGCGTSFGRTTGNVIAADGTSTAFTQSAGTSWYKTRLLIDLQGGTMRVDYQSLYTTVVVTNPVWIQIISGVTAKFNWGATTAANPGLWNGILFSSSSDGVRLPWFVFTSYPIIGTYFNSTTLTIQLCEVGRYWISYSQCQNCPAGSYGTGSGVSTCTLCQNGTYTSISQATVCLTCAVGSYSSMTGSTFCYNNTYPIFALISQNTQGVTMACGIIPCTRYVDTSTYKVTTLSVSSLGIPAISFDGTFALLPDGSSNVIQRATLTGTFSSSVIAGASGVANYVDAVGTNARFNTPSCVALSVDGTFALISDTNNHAIRKLNLSTYAVTTFAGLCTTTCSSGNADGAALGKASFLNPMDIAMHGSGNYCFVSDTGNNNIRRIDFLSAVVSTLSAVIFNGPHSLRFSGYGMLLVADRYNKALKVLNVDSQTVIGTYTSFNNQILCSDIFAKGDSALFVDFFGYKLDYMNFSTGGYQVVAGSGTVGTTDGTGLQAQLYWPIYMSIWKCGIPGMGVNNNNMLCERCAAGRYSGYYGYCAFCPVGTFNYVIGSTSSAACSLCSAGSYGTGSGGSACTLCQAGTFSTGLAQVSSSNCSQCPTGAYSTGLGLAICTWCIAGTYSTGIGQTSSSICSQCDAGKYSTALGSTICTSCPAGTYSNTTGLTYCSNCTLCDPNFATTFQQCGLGSTNNTVLCSCNSGYYGLGLPNTCSLCPAYTTSPINTTSLSGCKFLPGKANFYSKKISGSLNYTRPNLDPYIPLLTSYLALAANVPTTQVALNQLYPPPDIQTTNTSQL